MDQNPYYVYILASRRNGTVYTGSTNDLHGRMYAHKNHLVEGFSKQHNVTLLVWVSEPGDMYGARSTEMKIKNMRRKRKLRLIEESNPEWVDLAADWFKDVTGPY